MRMAWPRAKEWLSPLSGWDVLTYLFLAAVAFFGFNHSDLLVTVSHSTALYEGHFSDLYDFNRSQGAVPQVYYPSIYYLYALWGLPLYVVGLIPGFVSQGDVGLIFLWFKLLNVLAFIASVRVLAQIFHDAEVRVPARKKIALVWATSPLAFFSLLIFGQYDIFGLLFLLLSMRELLQGRAYRAALAFGISLTFKSFGVFCFLPMLLFLEKRALKLVAVGTVAVLPYLAQKLLYAGSAGFRESTQEFSASILGRFTGIDITLGAPFQLNPFFLLFALLLIGAWFLRPGQRRFNLAAAAWLSLAGLTLLFVLVPWHPQWLIWLTPFWAMTVYRDDRLAKRFMVLDVVFMVGFVVLMGLYFANNVDANLLKNGIFGSFYPALEGMSIARVNPLKFLPPTVWTGALSAILLAYLLAGAPWLKSKGDAPSVSDSSDSSYWHLLRVRAVMGAAAFMGAALLTIAF